MCQVFQQVQPAHLAQAPLEDPQGGAPSRQPPVLQELLARICALPETHVLDGLTVVPQDAGQVSPILPCTLVRQLPAELVQAAVRYILDVLVPAVVEVCHGRRRRRPRRTM